MKTPQLFRTFLNFVLGAGILLSAVTVHAQEDQTPNVGTVRIVDLQGYAIVTNKAGNGGAVPATQGDLLTEGYSISTAAGSSLILVLSNGVVVYVGPETTVEISKFSHDTSGEISSVSQPLSEQNGEIGTSNALFTLSSGTLLIDSVGLNSTSSLAIRDSNVTTFIGQGAVSFAQHASGVRSIVDINNGQLQAQGANEAAPSTKDGEIHHYENGVPVAPVPFALPVNSEAIAQRISNAKATSGAPAPVTPAAAAQLPIASSTNNAATQQQQQAAAPQQQQAAQQGTEETSAPESQPSTPPASDKNNIKDANNRDFTNPVTGDHVFTNPGTITSPSDDIVSIIE